MPRKNEIFPIAIPTENTYNSHKLLNLGHLLEQSVLGQKEFGNVMTRNTLLQILISFILVFTISGCSEYWWTRGQAPGVAQLLQRAEERLNSAMAENTYKRDELILVAKEVSESLSAAYITAKSGGDQNALLQSLEVSSQHFAQLEGQLSPGSRPPYGELSGQLRVFTQAAKEKGDIDASALGLFTARTKVFLASELSVPAPSFGA